MPRFNVGDRVRRVDDGGWDGDLELGVEAIVEEVDERDGSYFVANPDGAGWYGGGEGGEFDWELIEAADDGRMEQTLWIAFLYSNGGGGHTHAVFRSEREAERSVAVYPQMGYQVLGTKKITTRIQRPN